MSGPRYAIYYAPAPGTALWTFGSAVLGYDAATGARAVPLGPDCATVDEWEAMTAQPRRYGFHGTLKAPFRLADGRSEDRLVHAGRAFARKRQPFELPAMRVVSVGGFVALTPAGPSAELDRLADACVAEFEPFRAPPSEAELAKRLAAPLTGRQVDALKRWGYPYVFEDFRFHMTLTGDLPPDRAPAVAAGLAALFESRVGSARVAVDAVTLYVENDPAAGFRIVDRFVLGGR